MTSRKATAYIGLAIAAGTIALVSGVWHWQTPDWARYLSFCAAALIASGMKVPLTSVARGTLSVSFDFVLIGIAELGLGRRWRWDVSACWSNAYSMPRTAPVDSSAIQRSQRGLFDRRLRLAVSIGGYFGTCVMPVAAVIGFTGGKRVGSDSAANSASASAPSKFT